jgi:hypothetical protein
VRELAGVLFFLEHLMLSHVSSKTKGTPLVALASYYLSA